MNKMKIKVNSNKIAYFSTSKVPVGLYGLPRLKPTKCFEKFKKLSI